MLLSFGPVHVLCLGKLTEPDINEKCGVLKAWIETIHYLQHWFTQAKWSFDTGAFQRAHFSLWQLQTVMPSIADVNAIVPIQVLRVLVHSAIAGACFPRGGRGSERIFVA